MTNLESVPDITPDTIPASPEDLGDAGLELWTRINTTFDFADEPGKLAILEQAARTVDQIEALEEAKKDAPLTAKGSMGQAVIHPFIQELRQQRGSLNSLMKSLGLPESDEETAAKAERRSKAGKAGAAGRWGRQ
ncbi:hypothetical protein [Corynebacterium halotolerans]|uniref:hypothetical protein n=1 Tax=Corynebacterium halotolerans TaxID=225326 RepID=UPI003CEFC380